MNNPSSHICVFEYYFSVKISTTPQRNGWLQVQSRNVWDKSRTSTHIRRYGSSQKLLWTCQKDTGAKLRGLLLISNGTIRVTKGFITAIYWNTSNILKIILVHNDILPLIPPKEKRLSIGYLWGLFRFQIITLKTGKWKGVKKKFFS